MNTLAFVNFLLVNSSKFSAVKNLHHTVCLNHYCYIVQTLAQKVTQLIAMLTLYDPNLVINICCKISVQKRTTKIKFYYRKFRNYLSNVPNI